MLHHLAKVLLHALMSVAHNFCPTEKVAGNYVAITPVVNPVFRGELAFQSGGRHPNFLRIHRTHRICVAVPVFPGPATSAPVNLT